LLKEQKQSHKISLRKRKMAARSKSGSQKIYLELAL